MDNRLNPLTEKEWTVARLLYDGYSRKEIAEQLACTINTIHTHCRRMFRKLSVNNVTSLLKKLLEEFREFFGR